MTILLNMHVRSSIEPIEVTYLVKVNPCNAIMDQRNTFPMYWSPSVLDSQLLNSQCIGFPMYWIPSVLGSQCIEFPVRASSENEQLSIKRTGGRKSPESVGQVSGLDLVGQGQ
uniref:Uncharacterized protein n=1 Tax=Cacopsylla melanoneura TaxID=428564 RepID=A0A8D8T554_9HEMI